jgi:hypothetical protein
MMKRITALLPLLAGALFFAPAIAHAAGNGEVEQFTGETITSLIGVASLVAVFFLIRGGYIYITSTGKPEALSEAKRTIRSALIGLAIVIGAGVIYSLFNNAFTQPAVTGGGTNLTLNPIQPTQQDTSLATILLDAIAGFLQNIIQSAAKPILDAITGFLTNTPSLATNSVVFNFWLIMVGITDSLFALVIALLGFQVMSASTFGFEEISLKELLPRIGLAFLVANTSIFLIDWIILLCQTLVHAVLNGTGGLGSAWILNAFDPAALASGTTLLITLIFMIIFMVLSAVLLLFYIGRLMLLALGAVLSPLVCLLWLVPKTADFAESTIKSYLVTIFSIFIHVVIIQLASAFLTMPGQMGANPLISVMIGIALFSILLKSTALTVQLALTSQTTGALKKFGGQLFNVLSPATVASSANSPVVKARKAVR